MTPPSNAPAPSMAARIRALHRRRDHILRMPAIQALDAILNAPQPPALVHAIAEQDLYFLIHELDPAARRPLLRLASLRQWEFIVDMETWQDDRLRTDRLVVWLDELLRADAPRLIAWSLDAKADELALAVGAGVEVVIREHDQDPSELGDDWFTFDDVYYLRHRPAGAAAGDDTTEPRPAEALAHLLRRMADADYLRFQALLLAASGIIPAEAEETALHFRSVRLAERGVPPQEEALMVYRPLAPSTLAPRHRPLRAATPPHLPAVRLPAVHLPSEGLFTGALRSIAAVEDLHALQGEFALLSNHLIVADRRTVRTREDLAQVVRKASGTIDLGLERLGAAPAPGSIERAADLLRRHHLVDIFRTGYTAVLELKQRADAWHRRSWARRAGLALRFWGETWVGVVGGLLIKRPKYYDNYRSGALYRDFAGLGEVRATAAVLDRIRFMDALLARIDPPLDEVRRHARLSWANLLLTLWARHELGLAPPCGHLPFDRFTDFWGRLWRTPRRPRRIAPAARTAFIQWLAAAGDTSEEALAAVLGAVFDDLFAAVEEESGRVLKKDLDPRYIHLFLIDPL